MVSAGLVLALRVVGLVFLYVAGCVVHAVLETVVWVWRKIADFAF